jgi:hypothetical protein
MPQPTWEPVDFLDFFGVIPIESEYGVSYQYLVERGGLRLELSVWPLDSDIFVKIYSSHQSEPLIALNLLDCPAARVLHDSRGRFIEFAGGNAFNGRYDTSTAAAYGFRLRVEPYIQVEPYSYPT